MRYFLRYACMFCAMRLLWGFWRKRPHQEVPAPVCRQHASGVLLMLLALFTIVPLVVFGALGLYLSQFPGK